MGTSQIRLLGGFAVELPSGEVVHSLSQRRAEAVVAVLAVCGDLGCTRERLIGFFWPERDEAAARHNLRDALYAIRRTLGREAIPGSTDTLYLDPDVVSSDVQQFREALEADRLEDAVALYGGALLDGFHLDGALAFERWLEDERARLHRERQQAVTALARAAEADGGWGRAARWWARAVAADPYDSRLVARRIAALARAGDRANAVLEGEAHVRQLRSELELEPGAAFLEQLDRIRYGGVERSQTRTRTGPRLRPKRSTPSGSGATGPASEQGAPGSGSSLSRWARGRMQRIALAAVATAAATAVLVLVAFLAGSSGRSGPRVADPLQLTTATGAERSPSWSPDGRALAYHSTRDGDPDIWVTRIGTGEAVNRTASNPSDDLHPRWSPDGRWITFFSERRGGGYFIMPATGGAARKLAPRPPGELYPTAAAWSPDGGEIAYALGQGREPWIRVLAPADGATRRLPLPVQPRNNAVAGLSWSPDGRFLAYRRGISPIAATAELWLTRLSDGESIQLTDGSHRDVSPTWSPDSGELFFVSDRSGSPDLWRFTIGPTGRPAGPPRQVTAGLELTDVALGPEGERIAYTKGRRVHNVFRAPLLADRPAGWADVTQLTFDEADFESIDVGRDGRLLLSSDRSGNWDIYTQPAGGGPLRRLTTDSALDAGPSWKPDGSQVVFYSARSGHRQVWLLSVDGGRPRRLTYGPTEKLYPTWSPDGREIAVGVDGISVLTVETGTWRPLTRSSVDGHPDWSPDGRWVAFSSPRDGRTTLWRVPATGGRPERLMERAGRAPRWSPEGEDLYFLGLKEHRDTIWVLDLETREKSPVTAFTGRPGHLGRIGLAVDDRHVYFTWRESRGDLWVAELLPSLGS